METLFAIIILVFGVVTGGVMWIKSKKYNVSSSNPTHLPRQSPYEKHLAEHATDWNIRWQRKELVHQKNLLNEAETSGRHSAARVHRSMIVFGRSVINHLYQKLRESYRS